VVRVKLIHPYSPKDLSHYVSVILRAPRFALVL
jgi:hypothetical protein